MTPRQLYLIESFLSLSFFNSQLHLGQEFQVDAKKVPVAAVDKICYLYSDWL